jgi:hypothetical protein
MWGISPWLFSAGASVGCAAKVPCGREAGCRAGFEDCDSGSYGHGEARRSAQDLDYLRGYQGGLTGREREKVEKRDGRGVPYRQVVSGTLTDGTGCFPPTQAVEAGSAHEGFPGQAHVRDHSLLL